MIKTIINAFKIADIRKKLLFTAFIILIFRIGSVIPVPFVNIVDGIDVGKGNTIMTYGIDGIVLKIDDLNIEQELGNTVKVQLHYPTAGCRSCGQL